MQTFTTKNKKLAAWVQEIRALCRPDSVHWCDGSREEYDALMDMMVQKGMALRLNPALRPGSYLFRSDPGDVARVEGRTFIASPTPEEAGPTNNRVDPAEIRATLLALFRGCMAGRVMYVVPFSMGPVGSPFSVLGVEITDSPYVAASMRLMTHMGAAALDALGETGDFVPCLHSVGMPLSPGQRDVPWPCAPMEQKYIVHFTREKSIWSFGSGYGGNALLGKKCLALRIASVMAREGGWQAEHMLILRLTSPQGQRIYLTAAFPSACGKTNLAMLAPSLPGWDVRTLGDDIAWLRRGDDGAMRALNPEAGFFGVAPGTSYASNRSAMETIARDTIFTNVALTDGGDVWWEGIGTPAPDHLTDWQGRDWSPSSGTPAAHPNARFTVAAAQCPSIAPEWLDGQGVPISAILLGGRRPGVVPLAHEARSWRHGVFLGAVMGSEITAAVTDGRLGQVRRDPFAMLPFCGYHAADYLRHWLETGASYPPGKLPRFFFVNWFRKGPDGRFLWPGFGENARVLKWVFERVTGGGEAVDSPIGLLPAPGALDLSGLGDVDMARLMAVDPREWRREARSIRAYFGTLGEKLPRELWEELDALESRITNAEDE